MVKNAVTGAGSAGRMALLVAPTPDALNHVMPLQPAWRKRVVRTLGLNRSALLHCRPPKAHGGKNS